MHAECEGPAREYFPDPPDLRSGGDLNEIFRLNANRQDRENTRELGRRTLHAFIDFPIPIVVALQGDAMGLGATLVLTCDAIVAAKAARIADPHVKAGPRPRHRGWLPWPHSGAAPCA